MKRLKTLAREIHARSLWQVALIYVGFAWVAFRVAQEIIVRYDLPDIFGTSVVVLLIVGLPIVLITAYHQKGIPPLGRSDPNMQVDRRTSAAAEANADSRGADWLFSWRHAIMGGVVAFTIWAILAAGWLLKEGKLLGSAQPEVEQTVPRGVN